MYSTSGRFIWTLAASFPTGQRFLPKRDLAVGCRPQSVMGFAVNFAFMLPVMMLTFGCTFLVVARFGSREAVYWAMGFLCAAVAFAVPMLLSRAPIPVQALSADALFLLAFYGYSGALLARFRRPPSVVLRAIFCAIAYAGLVYAVLVLQSLPAELMISDIACAALLIFAIGACVHKARQSIDRILLGVASLIVVETIVRNIILLAVFAPAGGLDTFADSTYAFVMQAGASVIALLFALSALAATTLDTVAQYRDAAERDSLTGLLNRRGFEEAARKLKARGGLQGAVILGDIDHFKRINDTFGHAAGDAVIAWLAELLQARLPAGAFAARFGGEEFVAFLPGATLAEGGKFANAIRLGFSAADRPEISGAGKVTASFGVAIITAGDLSLAEKIGRADAALYAAKDAGRNRVMLEGTPAKEAPAIHVAS
jgi:diguanylate cyclase (GGDEF)-like protein